MALTSNKKCHNNIGVFTSKVHYKFDCFLQFPMAISKNKKHKLIFHAFIRLSYSMWLLHQQKDKQKFNPFKWRRK